MGRRPTRRRADAAPCQWISGHEAFRRFAAHRGGTQSAKHIKPLHWYIACRLVLEGGFHPDLITPRPPFSVTRRRIGNRDRWSLTYDPALGGVGEQIVLGGLKTKNVDVVVTNPVVGPVLAVSCKGVTKAFRNLTNRMEETIGECTNLHITYPAMVLGYFALLRANRNIEQALEAPEPAEDGEDSEHEAGAQEDDADTPPEAGGRAALPAQQAARIAANDIAITEDGTVTEGITRFHAALREMTRRRGVRDEISRYEAMAMVLVDPRHETAGEVIPAFPPDDSPLQAERFFSTLYQQYEERFVIGAPLLAERGITSRLAWDPESPVFVPGLLGGATPPTLEFQPRLAAT